MAAPTKTMTLAKYLALPETTQPTELLEGLPGGYLLRR